MKLFKRIRRWWFFWRRRKNPMFQALKAMAENAREVQKKIDAGELPRYEEDDEDEQRRMPRPW